MKKIFSLFVAVMAVCSLSAKSIFFNSGSWAAEPGRFAIYCITNESWVGLEAVSGEENVYQAEISDEVTQLVFCRMNPELEANEWASLWNQTEDLTIPANKDMYTITGWGEGYGAKATGEWSKHGVDKVAIYLDRGVWADNPDGGRYAVYCITNETWLDLVAVEGEDNVFAAEIAANVAKVVFCRMNPDLAANEWASLWNQTEDLTIPDDKDMFTITEWGESGAKSQGVWSKYGEVKPEPLEDGFYLVGLGNKWNFDEILPEWKFEANPDQEGEYQLKGIMLAEGDEFKVVDIRNNSFPEPSGWYGALGGDNFVVTADFVGKANIYFRQENMPEEWGDSHIWVNMVSETGVETVNASEKAVKCFENGQLVIIKGGVRYNALGAQF